MKTIITLQEIAVSLSSNEKQTAFNLEYLQKKGLFLKIGQYLALLHMQKIFYRLSLITE
jgi:hypothetical protein